MGDEAPIIMRDEAHAPDGTAPAAVFAKVHDESRFHELKRRHRAFVFPVLAACLVWYAAFVLLGAYAHDLMSTPVFGSVNVGILLGIAQIATTFIVTMIYVSYANRRLDPLAAELRDELEGEGVK